MRTDVTYAEVRTWAAWLDRFTATDLADAMGVHHELGQRGVTALLWHGICEETEDVIDGPIGPETIIAYIPIPYKIVNRNQEPPPEVIVFWEMGGDPLKQPRGLPVPGKGRGGKTSRIGQRHPGRTHGPSRAKAIRDKDKPESKVGGR